MPDQPASQEDIQIAKMVLAGWRFEPIPLGNGRVIYEIVSPTGGGCGTRSTRYTAALAAEREMMEYGVGLPA